MSGVSLSRAVSVKIPKTAWDRVRVEAEARGVSQATVLADAIDAQLGRGPDTLSAEAVADVLARLGKGPLVSTHALVALEWAPSAGNQRLLARVLTDAGYTRSRRRWPVGERGNPRHVWEKK